MTHLSLLTNNGHVIIEFDVIEQRIQEDVSNANQIVVLLRLVERVAFQRGTRVLEFGKQKKRHLKKVMIISYKK